MHLMLIHYGSCSSRSVHSGSPWWCILDHYADSWILDHHTDQWNKIITRFWIIHCEKYHRYWSILFYSSIGPIWHWNQSNALWLYLKIYQLYELLLVKSHLYKSLLIIFIAWLCFINLSTYIQNTYKSIIKKFWIISAAIQSLSIYATVRQAAVSLQTFHSSAWPPLAHSCCQEVFDQSVHCDPCGHSPWL